MFVFVLSDDCSDGEEGAYTGDGMDTAGTTDSSWSDVADTFHSDSPNIFNDETQLEEKVGQSMLQRVSIMQTCMVQRKNIP